MSKTVFLSRRYPFTFYIRIHLCTFFLHRYFACVVHITLFSDFWARCCSFSAFLCPTLFFIYTGRKKSYSPVGFSRILEDFIVYPAFLRDASFIFKNVTQIQCTLMKTIIYAALCFCTQYYLKMIVMMMVTIMIMMIYINVILFICSICSFCLSYAHLANVCIYIYSGTFYRTT